MAKTFKEFISEATKTNQWKGSPLMFPGSFGEMRSPLDSSVTESFESLPGDWYDHNKEYKTSINAHNVDYSIIHDDPNIQPKSLKPHHIESIYRYCSVGSDKKDGHGSSSNMNAMLRNMEGDKASRVRSHEPEKVLNSIKFLSSGFTQDNTNRKPMITFGGIPSHIGQKLIESGAGSHHYFPGFTSTTTDKDIAYDFGKRYNRKAGLGRQDPVHIVQYHIKPGAGLSAAAHSPIDENEVVLHHGAHVEYHGHEEINDSSNYSHRIILHHATVHSDHKPLEEYGSYDH